MYTDILTRKVELWILFTRFTREKTPQNSYSRQNFSVENNCFQMRWKSNQDMTPTFPQNLEKYTNLGNCPKPALSGSM